MCPDTKDMILNNTNSFIINFAFVYVTSMKPTTKDPRLIDTILKVQVYVSTMYSNPSTNFESNYIVSNLWPKIILAVEGNL